MALSQHFVAFHSFQTDVRGLSHYICFDVLVFQELPQCHWRTCPVAWC